MIAELEPSFDVAKRIWKEEEAPMSGVRAVMRSPKLARGLLRKIKDEVGDVVHEVKSLGDPGAPPLQLGTRPGDEVSPPIEGVTYRTWVTVAAGLERDEVVPASIDAYATFRGVPTGRWAAVDAAWQQRAGADPRVAAWRDHDVKHLAQLGARWHDVG
jgi:hypothetical protein